jgi:serine/threonine protein kinase
MTVSFETLVQLLSDSGVAQEPQVRALGSKITPPPAPPKCDRLVAELLHTGTITKFQAQLLLEGRKLTVGQYVLIEKLAQGGMGTVYRARHRHMDRIVALKVIRADSLDNEESVERFRREIKVISALRHPHIVTAFDAGEDEGCHYLVMELIEGLNLAQYVAEHGQLSVTTALRLIRQVAAGLDCIHQQGIVHRDIKPSNLLVDRHDSVKILDLGLSRLSALAGGQPASDLTNTGRLMGTADFMAPEQFANPREVDARADIYSLGCTLYYLLAGKPPFEGSSFGEKLIAHRERPRPTLRDRGREVSRNLDELIHRLIARSPEERPPSAREVIRLLDELESPTVDSASSPHADQLSPTRSVQTNQPATPPRNYAPWIVAGLILALLVTVGVALNPPWRTAASNSNPKPPDSSDNPKPPTVAPQPEVNTPVVDPLKTTPGNTAVPPSADELQRRAAQWILSHGGSIDMMVGSEYLPTLKPNHDLPKESFRIYRAMLPGCRVTDDDLETFAPLEDLILLDLSATKIRNDGLKQLGRLRNLSALNLANTGISDAGLRHLQGLESLKSLDLRGTGVTDDGLKRVVQSFSLTSLLLGEGQVTTDAGLKHLGAMSSLKSLGLRNTTVSDEGLVEIESLRDLDWLDLGLTKLSNAAVDHLEKLPKLKNLLLQGTAITTERVGELQKRNCQVTL